MKIVAQHITKRFGREEIISDFSHEFTAAASTALLGYNGSGKSTLLQMLTGYLSPSDGQITFYQNQEILAPESWFKSVSVCAPYLELIEELSLLEFLEYHFTFKKSLISITHIIAFLQMEKMKHKTLSHFSSGMKQRVKLAQAIFSDTPAVFLDEPCTNLDEQGVTLYKKMIAEFTQNRLVVVASNDKQEYDFCSAFINLMEYKKNEQTRSS